MHETAVVNVVRATLAEMLGVEEVHDDDALLGLGMDSLTAARVVGRLRSELTIELAIQAVFAHRTVGDFATTVAHLRAAAA